MTPLSRVSEGPAPGVNYRHDMVDNHKESDGPVPSSVTAGAPAPAVASTSNGLSIRFPEPAASSLHLSSSNPDIGSSRYQLRSTSRTRGSKCRSRPTLSLGTTPLLGALGDEDGEHDRNFEMMPAPSNAALHRYIRDLARVRMDLAAMQAGGENESCEQAFLQLELRVKAEQEATQNWVGRVCKAAGALSIVDPAFGPRK
jgi:hypothetical protein